MFRMQVRQLYYYNNRSMDILYKVQVLLKTMKDHETRISELEIKLKMVEQKEMLKVEDTNRMNHHPTYFYKK